MKRTFLALVATVILAAPASAMDCGKMLDQARSEISKMSKATAEKRAALTRMAVSGYDSCLAGDMLNAEKFFKMSMSHGN